MIRVIGMLISILLMVSCVEKVDSSKVAANPQNSSVKSKTTNTKAKTSATKSPKKVLNYGYAKLGNIAGKNTKKFGGNIPVTKSPFVIGGWAIDKANNSLPESVFVIIGGKQFRAKLGADSGYLTKTFKNKPAFAKAGFSVAINKDKLKKGLNEVSLRMVSKDGVTYMSKDKANIIVK